MSDERLDDLRTESQIQGEIIQELKERGAKVYRMNAGRGGRQNRSFNPNGTPDLFVVEPHRSYWIEVKTPSGKLSTDQEAEQKDLERYGQEVIVARGVEDV